MMILCTIISIQNCHPWCISGFCVVERIAAMRRQETRTYGYNGIEQNTYQSEVIFDINIREKSNFREQICSWSYKIIDYFKLSRQTVAISLDLFDRFFAKRDSNWDESYTLLASLTTLYIAIKIHETKEVKLCTLMQLCFGHFRPGNIIQMELKILKSLKWMVNPPTTVDFIYHVLKLFPMNISTSVRRTIFELSCYTAELSVSDSFFVGTPRLIIAFAAIMNVLDYEVCLAKCPLSYREVFLSDLSLYLDLNCGGDEVNNIRKRLRDILSETKSACDNIETLAEINDIR